MASLPLAHLRFGNVVQLESLQGARTRHRVQLVGALNGQSIMVTAHEALLHGLAEGDSFVVRIFTGDEALAFRAGVTRVCRTPFPYVHLTYPVVVEKALVRNARRARLRLSAEALPAAAEGGAVPVSIENLSIEGAQIESGVELGAVGARVELRVSLPLDRIGERAVTLPAEIRNLKQQEAGEGKSIWRHGVHFVDLSAESDLALTAFVYRELAQQFLRDAPGS